jgi:Iap family predicted aminopeptidase
VQLAEKLAAEHPEWCAYGAEIKGGNTEMADGLRQGIPSITLTGLARNGKAPYWHTPQDTFDKMNPEIMARAFDFITTYIRALDQKASQE